MTLWRRASDLLPTTEEIFQEAGTPAWGQRLIERLRHFGRIVDENGRALELAPVRPIATTTANRPVGGNLVLYMTVFDTDLGIPIWWDGANWIDATGATV